MRKILVIILLGALCICTYAQIPRGITRVTTRFGEDISPKPSDTSERFNVSCSITEDDTQFLLFAKEFVDGKHVVDDIERINSGWFHKGNELFWEVVPDTTNRQHIKLFMYFPGMITLRQKITRDDKCLKYSKFKTTKTPTYSQETPIMLIYEDDIPTGDTIILPDNRLLATVLNISQKRFSFFSEEGNLLNTIGEFPDYGEELKPLEKIEGFDGELLLGVDGIKFFFFHKQTDLIDVFDLSGSLIRRFHGPEHFMPHVKEKDYDNGTKVHSIPNVSKDAYFCPTLCGNEIYVLYSGKFYDPQINTYLHDQILVFDKEGNPLRRYRLSVPIFTFTVDMATRTIYGLSDDPDFRLVKFDIDS